MNVGELRYLFSADTRSLDKGFMLAKRGMKSMIGLAGGVGAALGVAFGVEELVKFGRESVHMATQFQASMTRVQTQAGGSARDVKMLSGQVLALAKHAQQGPEELADSLYHLKSVGMDNVDAMHALKTASDLAAVGGADLESTTNALAGAWRTGIKGAKNFGEAASTVNAIIGAGNMKMDDFIGAISTGLLPVAKTFGLTFK
jgi:TP901 family phage tail tape measure protein